MCGRFTLRATGKALAQHFGVGNAPVILPRYNIAPTQNILAVRLSERQEKEFASLRWGLIPPWAADPEIGMKAINVRADTVAAMPAYRHAFRRRRCLIPADGFFEWHDQGAVEQPMLIGRKDKRPFAIAGIWEQWLRGRRPIESCTILTIDADGPVVHVRDRMPLILSPDDYDRWLTADSADAERLLQSSTVTDLTMFPVGRAINNARNDVPNCVMPIAMLTLF